MQKTPSMRLVELKFRRPLEKLFTTWSREGYRSPQMAERIREHGIAVTDVAVRSWIDRMAGSWVLTFPSDGQESAD